MGAYTVARPDAARRIHSVTQNAARLVTSDGPGSDVSRNGRGPGHTRAASLRRMVRSDGSRW